MIAHQHAIRELQKLKLHFNLDRHVMGGTFLGRAPAFVVNLGGSDVAVTEQLLNLADVDAGIEEQGGGGRPAGNGCCRAARLP